MKTLSAFFFLLMVSSLVAFFSCKKKDDPAPTSVDGLLTYKAWQLTSIFYDGDQTLEKYQEDDYFVFYSNGTCVFITGESQERDSSLTKKVPPKKIPNKQINGVSTWALSGDHKTLITGLLGGSSQITITKDKLVLTKITGPVANNSASYQVLTCKPKEGEIAGGAVVLDGRYTYNSNNSKFIYTYVAQFASSDPATEVGFCWAAENESPTIDNPDNYLAEDNLGLTALPHFAFKKGAKKITISKGKSYYLRAYAKNSKGTFYSNASEIWGGE